MLRFEETGAYLTGHFRLTSGLHSPEFLQCAKVLQHPAIAAEFGERLAAEFRTLVGTVDLVVAPAMGGLIIGHEVARALGIRFIFTERDPDAKMVLRRGFSLQPGERAVLVEDVITTGGSSVEVIALIQSLGASVLAAGSIIDRSGGKADVGVPRVALATLNATTYQPESCPLCPRGYTLSFDGQGGGAGFAKGEARVSLAAAENGAATALSYTVKAQVGGKIAQIGSRLIDGAAQKLADDFFARFADAVAAKTGVAPAAAAPPRRWIRYVALALLAGVLAYLFMRMRR